jgi:drug/metabolite transporter (DMT)-like permease
VCLASVYYLGERLDSWQIVGIVMVCVGAWCISRTERNTIPRAPTP